MNILFVTNASGPDYMSDMVFHGGKTVFGKTFYESRKMWYMYDDVPNKNSLYGNGFTMYGKISSSLYSELPSNINDLIYNKFFHKIIYGSIWRCNDYFDIVSKVYVKDDIIIIDGEDELDRINYNFSQRGRYFKREYSNKIDGVYPISFSVPKELVLSDVTEKSKLISDIIPNSTKNYSYNNEIDYYSEYSKSWYAITKKKGGWDCLRHYEIMMNGCIPLFEDLDNCPSYTLHNFPKKEIIEFSKSMEMNLDQNKFILEYTRKNLTTKNLIKNLLQ
jgi:hypothetical protein